MLVMFFEGIRSERQLMRHATDRLSIRWYICSGMRTTGEIYSFVVVIWLIWLVHIASNLYNSVVSLCFASARFWALIVTDFDFHQVKIKSSISSSPATCSRAT